MATTTSYPNTTEEQAGFYYPTMINNSNVSTGSDSSNEEILWDGLWNLDDYGNFSSACATSKASLHNLVTPFC
ncbi:hypothetical protein COLO4_15994 [Corchorus olitorius]|uniref:Uncharacterized protein n=1 Tax=Corchorus olitorius TaxID=93759 RepID=A0A1R3JKH2_9ROSI|nr:hypothetical protein COLO4_15994 [Corchorus olitorius]